MSGKICWTGSNDLNTGIASWIRCNIICFPTIRQSAIFDWTVRGDAAGHFEIGTISNTTIACLSHSLPLIRQLGVENIQAHRQPLVARIQKELPRFGFEPLTPPESKSSIVAFAMKDTQPIARS